MINFDNPRVYLTQDLWEEKNNEVGGFLQGLITAVMDPIWFEQGLAKRFKESPEKQIYGDVGNCHIVVTSWMDRPIITIFAKGAYVVARGTPSGMPLRLGDIHCTIDQARRMLSEIQHVWSPKVLAGFGDGDSPRITYPSTEEAFVIKFE